ncbi:MAG: apolipoprotein N-acyltransferase [Gammaproteobacteria bacterium]|nr:MAG: apolipoprotein N-acyltransferase [Gammaproteobacteria bacterium]
MSVLGLKALLVSIAGAILVFAYAPFSIGWLTFVCPVVLYVAIARQSAGIAATFGFIFGLFFFGFGVPWTFNSIHEFGHAPLVLSAFLAGLMVIVLALFPAGAAGLTVYLNSKKHFSFSTVVTFACLWVGFEWIRSWIFTGFPWLLIGHVHHSGPLQGILPVFGTYGASWLSVLFGCLVAVILFAKFKQKILSALSIIVIAISLYFVNQIAWTHADDEKLDVVLVQGNISQEMKWDQSKHTYIMEKYLQMSKKHFDADIIIWPETAIPTYYSMVKDSFIQKVGKTADQNNIDYLIGVFTFDPANGHVYNSVMTLGSELSFYRKQRLVPFGEYLPFRGVLTFLERYIDIPMADISSGEGRPLVRLKGYPVGSSICYEAVYGNQVIEAMPEAKFLVNVSNDAWFGDSLAPHQHLEITRSRAVETGRYLLRATNTGISAVINPNGIIVNKSVQFQDDVIRATISPYSGVTPYARWGNWGIVSIVFSCLAGLGILRWLTRTH